MTYCDRYKNPRCNCITCAVDNWDREQHINNLKNYCPKSNKKWGATNKTNNILNSRNKSTQIVNGGNTMSDNLKIKLQRPIEFHQDASVIVWFDTKYQSNWHKEDGSAVYLLRGTENSSKLEKNIRYHFQVGSDIRELLSGYEGFLKLEGTLVEKPFGDGVARTFYKVNVTKLNEYGEAV